MKKFEYVDALRGWAVLMVMFAHTITKKPNLIPELKELIAKGAYGVQLFFIMSAFTLYHSYHSRATREHFSTSNFFLRRIFRIAPLYWLAIIYYLWQDGFGPRRWLGDARFVSTENILSNFTFTNGFNPEWINSIVPGGWSIGIEFIFYACMPFIFSRVSNLRKAFNFFLFALVFRILVINLLSSFHPFVNDVFWNEFLYFSFPSQFPVFALGVVLYYVVIRGQGFRDISPVALLSLAGLSVGELLIGGGRLMPNHIMVSMSFVVAVIALSRRPVRFLVNPVITYVGQLSYSMYIVHFAVLHMMAMMGLDRIVRDGGILNHMARFIMLLSLTVMVSIPIYRTLELPFMKLGQRFIRWRESSPLSTSLR
jgi:peptidoglycan/LPS O-acetylase OafA/YrhL